MARLLTKSKKTKRRREEEEKGQKGKISWKEWLGWWCLTHAEKQKDKETAIVLTKKKNMKERWVEKHGWSGGAWHWRVGVRDEQRTTVHQLFPSAFPFFSCFPLSCFISWWFGPNSLSQLLSSFLDCWLSKQHDGRVWLLVVGAVSQGHRAIRAKGPHRKYFCWDLHTLLFNIISSISFS